jgi:amidase
MKHLLFGTLAVSIAILGCSPSIELSKTTQPVWVDTDFRATGILAGSLPDVIQALNSKEISSQNLVKL